MAFLLVFALPASLWSYCKNRTLLYVAMHQLCLKYSRPSNAYIRSYAVSTPRTFNNLDIRSKSILCWNLGISSAGHWNLVDNLHRERQFNCLTRAKFQKDCLSSQWRHNGRDSVSNHQPHDCLLNRLFRRRSKKTSKVCVTVLCVGNSPVTG